MSSPQSIPYATPKPPRGYSRLGVIAVFLGLLHLMLAAVGTWIVWGAVAALNSSNDAGGPIAILFAFGLVAAAALALILLWLLGRILAVIGSFRSARRCWWSLSALHLHTILPLAIVSAMLYRHWYS